ncbi:hypothetical protein [Helicobacter ailurogastricus]|uniref:Uncharacterized protein n=1 Tax=Helicobacter ailurogastricus TaxID=1578720 RepID=A0A0K2X3V2_9HELI|nr:hypothetical protein [Helicobacter ailurogastricus]GMB92013.1 hypothetical protein NHP190009_11890 [Helicobacter ailurogastricus]CRF41785.1 hypothetical protein HAL011_16000 [Helicobacter ailurogastricus]CRF42138.1 hypothetical protein HAL013_02970 [Helicobacter ailurogastricus]CRF43470.1 hypothetical protein HAL09_00110 [Helicobacter ailurogastricus]
MVWRRKDSNLFTKLWHLPKANQNIKNALSARFTYMDLQEQDILQSEKVGLKDRILLIEDDVLANSGENAFEEVFKLIFPSFMTNYKPTATTRTNLQGRGFA